jgi:hypothetical protein
MLMTLMADSAFSGGSEHPACRMPFPAFDSPSTDFLRSIASSCRDEETAMLFYNRAYHREVMADLRRLCGLETGRDGEDEIRYEQGRIFIAVAEEMARIAWIEGRPGTLDALNAAYDRSIETAEYTIKGYNLLIGGAQHQNGLKDAPD